MSKTFDAVLKQIVDRHEAAWGVLLCDRMGLAPGCGVELLDPDLSTISPQADKAFRLTGPATGIIHVEFQANWDGQLEGRLLVYNVLLEHRHGGPGTSVVFLLRREGNAANLTGTLNPDGVERRVPAVQLPSREAVGAALRTAAYRPAGSRAAGLADR